MCSFHLCLYLLGAFTGRSQYWAMGMESVARESLPLFQLCNFSCIQKSPRSYQARRGDIHSFKTVVYLAVIETNRLYRSLPTKTQ